MMMFKHDDDDDAQAFSLSAFKPSTVKQFNYSSLLAFKPSIVQIYKPSSIQPFKHSFKCSLLRVWVHFGFSVKVRIKVRAWSGFG